MGGPSGEPSKDANKNANQTALAQVSFSPLKLLKLLPYDMELIYVLPLLIEKYSGPSSFVGCWESVGPCCSPLYGNYLRTVQCALPWLLHFSFFNRWMMLPCLTLAMEFFQALRCIGNLVLRNPQNLDSLARKQVGEEPHVQPALNAILSIILRTSIAQEFVAADYVFKCFCEVVILSLCWIL